MLVCSRPLRPEPTLLTLWATEAPAERRSYSQQPLAGGSHRSQGWGARLQMTKVAVDGQIAQAAKGGGVREREQAVTLSQKLGVPLLVALRRRQDWGGCNKLYDIASCLCSDLPACVVPPIRGRMHGACTGSFSKREIWCVDHLKRWAGVHLRGRGGWEGREWSGMLRYAQVCSGMVSACTRLTTTQGSHSLARYILEVHTSTLHTGPIPHYSITTRQALLHGSSRVTNTHNAASRTIDNHRVALSSSRDLTCSRGQPIHLVTTAVIL